MNMYLHNLFRTKQILNLRFLIIKTQQYRLFLVLPLFQHVKFIVFNFYYTISTSDM